MPFDWLKQLVRQLPGLHTAEPITLITLGLCAVALGTIVLLLLIKQPPRLRVWIAIMSLGCFTVIWGMAILMVLYSAGMHGRMDSYERNLITTTFPTWYLTGHLLIWSAYWLPRLFTGRRGGISQV